MTTSLPAEFTHLRDGYSANLSYPVLEFQVDRGKTRKRHDPLYVPHVLNVQWTLDDGQYTRLMGFFRNDLDFGTLPFLMDVVTDLSVATTHKCRCVGGLPRLTSQSGLNYKVQCTIEAFANPTYTGLLEYQAPNEILFSPTYPPLVGPWRFEDTLRIVGAVGTHPDDDTVIDLDGVYSIGPASTTSVDWVFDGVDDNVLVGDFLHFQRTQPFTISAWFTTSSSTNSRVVGNEQTGTSARGYCLVNRTTAPAGLMFQLCNDSNLNANGLKVYVPTGTFNVVDGNEHHVVVVYDGSSLASGVTIYIDQTSYATTAFQNNLSATTIPSATTNLRVGATDTGAYHTGSIRHVSIWSTNLSPAEVAELSSSGNPSDLDSHSAVADLELWLKLDETDAIGADGIVDHSGNGLDGTANFNPTLSGTNPGLETNIIRLNNPHVVNSDWTVLASLTPDSFGPSDAGNKISSITRVPT